MNAQEGRKMKILNADVTYSDEQNPNLTISIGNVIVEIDGATLSCKRVEIYNKENYLKARGNVILNQGDTIIQTSKFADYDANTKLAKAWGDVLLKDPTMSLKTETLNFDRKKQYLYYNTHGVINDSINVLKSKVGKYFLENNKFQALSKVVITNPDHVINTNHLDYYTDSGRSYLYKPSTIKSDKSLIYTERGFHDSKTKVSHLTKNSWIKYDDRKIQGDSLYYDENRDFSSATGNIIVTDTINNGTLKGGYGEFYRAKDSAFLTDRAVAISLIEKDSMYIHGDTLLLTGKPDKRIIKAYNHVKFFKSDLSGKCDSLYSNQGEGITKMFRKPILWSQENQITGDVIHFLHNKETEQLDSLKVLGNSFMIQKDSIGFNQTKGRDILGKFEDNDLKIVDVVGNGEVIHFIRNEEKELVGIMKMRSSSLNLTIDEQQIQTIEFQVQPSGKTYPEEELHVNDRTIKGMQWRINEKPKDKDGIFIHDKGDDKIMQEERVKERLARIQAIKDAEEKRIRDLEAKKLQEQQDSIAAENAKNADKVDAKVKESSKKNLKEAKETKKKDE